MSSPNEVPPAGTCMVHTPLGRERKPKYVKNLRWLLDAMRKKQHFAEKIRVITRSNGEADLWVRFTDGYRFTAAFADQLVLMGWLRQRRLLSRVPCHWNTHKPVPCSELPQQWAVPDGYEFVKQVGMYIHIRKKGTP